LSVALFATSHIYILNGNAGNGEAEPSVKARYSAPTSLTNTLSDITDDLMHGQQQDVFFSRKTQQRDAQQWPGY
jgi:hypothetical protein